MRPQHRLEVPRQRRQDGAVRGEAPTAGGHQQKIGEVAAREVRRLELLQEEVRASAVQGEHGLVIIHGTEVSSLSLVSNARTKVSTTSSSYVGE